MKAELINYVDHWQEVKDAAMNTIGKESGKYPDSAWKKRILLAEHSPIRLLTFTIRLTDIPYFCSTHFCRHHEGVTHFVSTQRTDRTGIDRDKLPQDALVTHTMVLNAQAMINISRKRLCSQADKTTRLVWNEVLQTLYDLEPELWSACVRECVYRNFCPEMRSCGYCGSDLWKVERKVYLGVGECSNN